VLNPGRRVGARVSKARGDIAEQRAVGLRGRADLLAQLVAGSPNRQLRAERLDVARVQIGRDPARHPGRPARDLRRHVGIAIAIAANPGAEAQRRRIERYRLAECVVELAHIARHRLPKRLLEHRQRAADFIERGDRPIAHFVGLPDDRNLAPKRVHRRFRFVRRQVRTVADRQHVGDPSLRLQQRAADDLGGVGGQHQLDPQRSHGVRQRIARETRGTPACERIGTRARLRAMRRIASVVAAPADPMMLLGDVGQREEMRERPRDRYGRGHRQRGQSAGQLFEGRRLAGVRELRERANLFYEREQRIAFARAQRVAEQLAQ